MNMPKFIQIIGPQAVGKMTVGQELAKITGYKLLYNHMTIEMVRLIFDYDKEAFRKMNSIIRYEIFKEFSKSNEKGIIFTGCFDFGNNFEKEKAETDKWMSLFEGNYTVELETTLEERLKRNKTANRLEHKESKRDLEWSEKDIYRSLEKYRLNSKPGEGEKIFKNFYKIDNTNISAEKVDFCLITHTHVDHIGRLPYMVKKGFYRPIYVTETTNKLLPLALNDSFKVLSSVSKRKNVKCLYSEADVDKTLSLLKPCRYNETIRVNDNVKITFLNNGHLVGAALILVQISYPEYEDINLLFTGDYNNKNMFFDVNPIPKWILELPLTVIQESTYGDMDSTEIKEIFKENIKKCIESDGTVLTLVFSLGRAQEILYELKCMQENCELDSNIPIYFDGKLAIRYTNLYIKDGLGIKPEMKDFLPQNLTFVDNESRSDVLKSTSKKIIVTTSGMGSYGPAQVYIPEYISRSNTLIHFTGYTAEGTMGGKLKNAETGSMVEVGGLIAKKRANVEYTTEYSAHAKADEMIEFLKQFKNLKLVLVNHGESQTKNIFAERIVEEVDAKRVGLLGREYFFRIDSYGLVKTLSTKFQ